MAAPAHTQRWLDDNAHRMDLACQFLGDEPNARRTPWEPATVRWCLVASWPYEAAAGNSSIPAVYKAINDAGYLCDRWYLPATPRDLRLLDKAGIGCFGIESKQPLTAFDVIGSSISYPVLAMSYIKQLTMSGIPARWADRDPNTSPMVIVGGQSYGAPEVLSPVVDCWWLGEVEDEPGNPGIATVCQRIADFKAGGHWNTDRLGCYTDLGREFPFLYFPRLVTVGYDYEDRHDTGAGPLPSKQVTSYTSTVDGLRMPFKRRYVKDLNNTVALVDPPLLYADPAMGSGDLEVARGCPAWCSFCALCLTGDTQFITIDGVRRLDALAGSSASVWTEGGWKSAIVDQYGTAPVNTITLVPADFGGFGSADTCAYGHPRIGEIDTSSHQTGRTAKLTPQLAAEIRDRYATGGVTQAQLAREYGVATPQISLLVRGKTWQALPAAPAVTTDSTCRTCRRIRGKNAYYRRTGQPHLVQELERIPGWHRTRGFRQLPRPTVTVTVRATADHRWPLVDGTETHHLAVGDFVRGAAVREVTDPHVVERGFVHGLIFGDGTKGRTTKKGLVFSINLFGEKDRRYLPRLTPFLRSDLKYQSNPVSGIAVLHIGGPTTQGPNGVSRVHVRLVTDIEMKEFPPPEASPDYLRGFLDGWLAADGTNSDGPDSVKLTTQHPGAQSWLINHAAVAGRLLIGHTVEDRPTNFGERKNPLQKFTLASSQAPAWKVQAIEVGSQPEPVFCATVDDGHGFFTLASGIYTGNTYRQKPYRQRTVESVVGYAQQFQNNMGSVRMAPFSPDFPMYTQRKKLIRSLLERVSDEVDAPTMRVDDFVADNQFILLQVHGGMDSVTLGVEGSSQRMRDLVGKGTADADIREAVTRGIRAGIRKIKLFFISNLPGEDEGDVIRVLKLAKDLADIRDSMAQPNVRIQFSWTPLLVEANTPFQWFAPQTSNRILGDVWEEFRDLKIDFKLGAKGEPNKAAFFQACQRASRDVGEALVDAMLDVDQACWGGVPRHFRDLIDDKLKARGFHNGLADCFDERVLTDMFGWEMIDQGISVDLLWSTYRQMCEFITETDSHTYDANYDDSYHGNEWISRCDVTCHGKRCGACDFADLRIRKGYLQSAAFESTEDLSTVKPVDQRSQAFRLRARIVKQSAYRTVGNDHWRFNLRRSAFRAQARLGWEAGIAKRSIVFASDSNRHRDLTAGLDYVEFAFTRKLTPGQIQTFVDEMNVDLRQWLTITDWVVHPAASTTMRTDVDYNLYDLELDVDPAVAVARLAAWRTDTVVPMRLKVDGGYFAPTSEQVNAHDYVDDLWLVRYGTRLKLRMLVRGKPSPYNIYAAFMRRSSWLDAARNTAIRLEAFVVSDRGQHDFVRPNCQRCGWQIPTTVLDTPYHPSYCPRCLDEQNGVIFEELTPA